MNNANVYNIVLLAALSWCLMKLINTFKVKKTFLMLFNKKNNNKLPVDYDYVHSQLDSEFRRLAKKYNIKLRFEINEKLINSGIHECFVFFFGENYTHEFSFTFFGRLKNTQKKTSVLGIKHLVLHISSDLEDKIMNFLILDKLITLDKKPTVSL